MSKEVENVARLLYSRECNGNIAASRWRVWKAKQEERQRELEVIRLADEYSLMLKEHPHDCLQSVSAPRGTMSWYRIDSGASLFTLGGDVLQINPEWMELKKKLQVVLDSWFELLAVGDTFSTNGHDDVRRTIVKKSEYGCNQAMLDDGLLDEMDPFQYIYIPSWDCRQDLV